MLCDGWLVSIASTATSRIMFHPLDPDPSSHHERFKQINQQAFHREWRWTVEWILFCVENFLSPVLRRKIVIEYQSICIVFNQRAELFNMMNHDEIFTKLLSPWRVGVRTCELISILFRLLWQISFSQVIHFTSLRWRIVFIWKRHSLSQRTIELQIDVEKVFFFHSNLSVALTQRSNYMTTMMIQSSAYRLHRKAWTLIRSIFPCFSIKITQNTFCGNTNDLMRHIFNLQLRYVNISAIS